MNFFRTSFWASIATAVTMICGLITTKYVATIIGPEGMAYVGQFSNSVLLLTLFASAACGAGITKLIAEYKEESERKKIAAAALFLVLICTIAVSLISVLFSDFFSSKIFNNNSFSIVFVIYGLLVIFPTINGVVISVLNGLHEIKRMALLNVSTSIVNVAVIITGAYAFGIKGVLVANLLSAAITFILYYFTFKKAHVLPSWQQIKKPERFYIKSLLGFSVMNLVSGIVAPSIQLMVRTKLLYKLDTYSAGIWQANTRLSDYYLNFVYTVIGIYYLPKLSSLNTNSEIKRELRLGYVRIIPIVLVITSAIWFSRDLIIKYLLTEKFSQVLVLLKWQLLGDIIKISSWIIGYLLVAKAMKKTFISLEIIFSITYVILNYVFINYFGLIGTVYGFCINYCLYLAVLLIILRRYIF